MTDRQPFAHDKSEADFERAKLAHCWKPDKEGNSRWRVCWSPGGNYIAWSLGDSSVRIIPWNKKTFRTEESVQTEKWQFQEREIASGKPVKALALGSSLTGTEADFGTPIPASPSKENAASHSLPDGPTRSDPELYLGQNELRVKGQIEPMECIENSDSSGSRSVPTVSEGSNGSDVKPSWFRFHKVEGLILATGFQNGNIRCWNAHSGDLIFELQDHTQAIEDLKFAPDGSLRLVSCCQDGSIKLWDLKDDGNMYKTLRVRGYKGSMSSCAWSPDASALVTAGQKGMVAVWDMDEDKLCLLHTLTGHQNTVSTCQFSPDGALLLTASYDTKAILSNPYTGNKLMEFRHLFPAPSLIFACGANHAGVLGATLSANSQYVVTICEDRYVRLWDLFNPDLPRQIVVTSEPHPTVCTYSPDSTIFVIGPNNQGISFYHGLCGSPLSLARLSRIQVQHSLQQKTPATRVPELVKRLVECGLVPRDIGPFLLYETL